MPTADQSGSSGNASGPCSQLTRSALRRVCTLLSLPFVATAQNPPAGSAMIIGSGKLLAYTGLVKPAALAGWG